MWLAHYEISECYFSWFGDEGFFPFETLLLSGHVEAVLASRLLVLLFLKKSAFSDIELPLLLGVLLEGLAGLHLKY